MTEKINIGNKEAVDLDIEKLISLSLTGGTEAIRNKLNIHSAAGFVEYIADLKNISLEEARTVIKNNHKLMGLMFCIAWSRRLNMIDQLERDIKKDICRNSEKINRLYNEIFELEHCNKNLNDLLGGF